MFVVNEADKNPDYVGKIARVHIPPNPKGKPLIILFTGNGEKIPLDEDRSGISHTFHKIKEDNNAIVIWFRTGFAMDEVKNLFVLNGKYAYEHEVVYEHTKNIIEDLIKEYNPSEIRMAGYSWGGGTIQKLSHDKDCLQGKPVKVTVMVDAIELGMRHFRSSVRERPEFNNSPNHIHFHYYQKSQTLDKGLATPVADILLPYGDTPIKRVFEKRFFGLITTWHSVIDKQPGDVIERIPDTDHMKIDNVIKDKIYSGVISGMSK